MWLLYVSRNNYTCFISNAKIYKVTARRQDLQRRARCQDLWHRSLVHVGARSPSRPMPRQDLGAIGHGAETCFLDVKSHGAEVRVHKRKSNHQRFICEYFKKKLKNKKFGRRDGIATIVDEASTRRDNRSYGVTMYCFRLTSRRREPRRADQGPP